MNRKGCELEPWERIIEVINSPEFYVDSDLPEINDEIREIISTITHRDNSKYLWKDICKRLPMDAVITDIPVPRSVKTYAMILISVVISVKGSEHVTVANHKKQMLKLAQSAQNLLALLESSELENTSICGDKNISYAYEYLGGRKDFAIASVLRSTSNEAYFSFCHLIDEMKNKLAEKPSTRENISKSLLLDAYPQPVCKTLKYLIQRAADAAEDDLLIMRSRDRDEFELKLAAVYLHRFHLELFGTPLWDTLAMAVSLALATKKTLTKDDIRPLVR